MELYPAVSITNMEVGEVSNATSMMTEDQKEAYCIVRVDKKLPQHRANLVDDYDRISTAALQEAKDKKLIEWSGKMIKNTYIRISDEYKDCDFRLNWTGKK